MAGNAHHLSRAGCVSILYQSRLSFWHIFRRRCGVANLEYPSSINRGYRSGLWPLRVFWRLSSYPSSINRGYRSGLHGIDGKTGLYRVSILYQSRLSFWPGAQSPDPTPTVRIHPLSIEAIVLARLRKMSLSSSLRYPSSINRGYRSGKANAANTCEIVRIHPLSIEAIVLACESCPVMPKSAMYPSSINRGYRSGWDDHRPPNWPTAYPSSINRGYRSGSTVPLTSLAIRYPSSINRGYRSGLLLPPKCLCLSCIHPLSIEAIVLAFTQQWRWAVILRYPSSINRGYRSGDGESDTYRSEILVSILYQSRLSFWPRATHPINKAAKGIHPLSIEAIVLAPVLAPWLCRQLRCIHPLSIEAIVLAPANAI